MQVSTRETLHFQGRQQGTKLENNIDGKPKRPKSRRRPSERLAVVGDQVDEVIDDHDVDHQLNVRVKGRDGDAPVGRKLGGFFKDPSTASIKEAAGEAMKRPLTGLFRRPARPSSAAGKRVEDSLTVTAATDGSVTPDLPRRNSSLRSQPVGTEGIARAPHISLHRSTNLYGPLDSIARSPALSKLDNIDLSLLSRFLCAEEETRDENSAWTWDYVFASVSSEMREEWALDEMEEDDVVAMELGRHADSLRMIA